MPGLFQCHAQPALVLCACAGFTAWLNFAPIRDVALHKAARILVIDLAHMVMAKLANFAASAAFAAPASLAARSSIRSSLHEHSPHPPVTLTHQGLREVRLSHQGTDQNHRPERSMNSSNPRLSHSGRNYPSHPTLLSSRA